MSALIQRHASLLVFLAVLLFWEGTCRLAHIPEYIFPAPSQIWLAASEMGLQRWLEHVTATLQVALIGYALAIALAIPLAIAQGLRKHFLRGGEQAFKQAAERIAPFTIMALLATLVLLFAFQPCNRT
mgnify:CR=1 FL=1